MESGTDGWKIYNEISPIKDEIIFHKKYNSAFYETNLRKHLNEKGIDTIILVGLQTEYCIDATCKSAFDYKYKIIIPEDTNSSFDNDYLTGENLYKFYNFKVWNGRFADVMPMDSVIKMIQNK